MRAVDFSRVTNAEAKEALAENRRVVEIYVSRTTRKCGTWRYSEEDIRVAIQCAVVEALATYEPDRGAQLASWTHSVIRWRLAEMFKPAAVQEVSIHREHEDGDGYDMGLSADTPTPEALAVRAEAADWLQKQINRLSPREAYVLTELLAGESTASMAEKVGLTRQRVHQIVKKVRQKLAENARLAGLDLGSDFGLD